MPTKGSMLSILSSVRVIFLLGCIGMVIMGFIVRYLSLRDACVYLCVCLRDISVCAEVSARGIRCERYMHMREISVSEKDIKVAEPHGFTGCINMVSVSHGIICIY
jgi:hypothetical protein